MSHALIEPEARLGMKPEPRDLDDAIVESPVNDLDLVPADIRLASFEMQPDYLAHRPAKQVREHASDYDLVFVHCPPQLGKLLTAALYSADHVLAPGAADAMGDFRVWADLAYPIEQVCNNVSSDLKMLGAVINSYKPQRNLVAESRAAVDTAVALVHRSALALLYDDRANHFMRASDRR